MKFKVLFRILDLLHQGKEIGVSLESEYDSDVNIINRFTIDDDIGEFMRYITDNQYHFYIIDYDGFASNEEIKGD